MCFFKPFVILDFFHVFISSNCQVHAALDLVDEMCEVGLTLSLEALHSVLHAIEESFDFNLVRCIIPSISPLPPLKKKKTICSCCALLSNADFNNLRLELMLF